MNVLPPELHQVLTESLGCEPLSAEPVGGGMINCAARVVTSQGDLFVKWKPDAPPRFFATEADGLNRLRSANAIRVPQVLAFQDESSRSEAQVPFLALEWIQPQPPRNALRFAERLGQELALLHRLAPSPDGTFGLEIDNYLGAIPQINTPCADWPSFYRDCRLLPQIERERRNGLLSVHRERLLMTIVERVDAILEGLKSTPALIHGDLWSGNLLAAGDEPVLIDPAVYYGEREMEIAYMELFGGFSPRTFDAYREAYPLTEGYEYRRPLHQLYHLINHLNHFGETYGPGVDRACRFYVG